jgi:rhomboid-like protein
MNRSILLNIKHTHKPLCRARFISTSLPRLSPRHNTAPLTNSIGIEPEPLVRNIKPQGSFPRVRYVGPALYGLTLSASIFLVAGTVFNRNQQTLWDRLRQHSRSWNFFRSASEETILAELWREKREMLNERRLAILENLAQRLNGMALPLGIKRAVWMVGEKVASMSEAEKTIAGLIAINTVVFACWQIPRLTPFMSKWFLHLPGSRQNITLLTSCFSHQEFFHFALNMVGLWSFGRVIHDNLGREQFLAMYLGVGIGANVVSHVASLAMRHSRPLLPSLGASGAIYGLVASTAVLYPESSISLIFLPMIPINLG